MNHLPLAHSPTIYTAPSSSRRSPLPPVLLRLTRSRSSLPLSPLLSSPPPVSLFSLPPSSPLPLLSPLSPPRSRLPAPHLLLTLHCSCSSSPVLPASLPPSLSFPPPGCQINKALSILGNPERSSTFSKRTRERDEPPPLLLLLLLLPLSLPLPSSSSSPFPPCPPSTEGKRQFSSEQQQT